MKTLFRKCGICGKYTLDNTCCGTATHVPVPPKYSPEDPYGKYRRITIMQEWDSVGEHDKV